jgi:hypothetical protein
MACNTQTYNLGVVNILLGEDRVQKFCTTFKADVSGSLENKYWVYHEPVTFAKHYVWYQVGGSGGVDPAIPNATGHMVDIATNASASAVATATAAVLNALAHIGTATATGDHMETTFTSFGYAYPARDALATASKTTFTIVVTEYGSVQADMGATDGDTTFTIEESTLEVVAPQTGDYVLDEINKGSTVAASFSLKDTSQDSIRKAIGFYGQVIVTDDAASKTVAGYGSSNLYKSTLPAATRLIFRPTRLAGDANATEDFSIHKARLKLGEITFSAENELLLPIEATGYLDTTKTSQVNLWSYGDASAIPSV